MLSTRVKWIVGGAGVMGMLTIGCAHHPATPAATTPAAAAPAERAPAAITATAKMFDRQSGWIAADGASTVDLGDGRSLWLFGDTLIGSFKADGGAAEGTIMVNNTIGIARAGADEIDFRWGPARGDKTAMSWAHSPSQRGEADAGHWMWPAGGGVRLDGGIGDRVVLFFMTMRKRAGAADGVWNFQQHGLATVTILNPADPVAEWRTEISPLRDYEAAMDAGEDVRIVSWGPAAMIDPEDASRVLVYGVDTSDVLRKQLLIARAPRDTLDRFDTWEFRTTSGWSASERDAAPIAAGMVDEFSIHRQRIGDAEKYVLTQSEPNLGARIFARFADLPQGPWSDGVELYTCPEPASDRRLMVYSAKAHPEMHTDDGSLVVTYCVNSTDFWHMLANARLYRPRVIRVPASSIADGAAGTHR